MTRAIEQLRQAMEACELGALTLPDQVDALMDAGKAILQEVPTLTPQNEWASVEERLPEPTYCALVYTTDYSIEVDAIGSDGEWMSFEVTHWMPLPAQPEKET